MLFPGGDKSGCLHAKGFHVSLGLAHDMHDKPERFSGFSVFTVGYLPRRPYSDTHNFVDLSGQQYVGSELIGHRGFFYVSGADELTESRITGRR